ncbi:hypothetical protein SEA_RIZWANA_66 [Arthrobacter phage Rizwana]|nr:hypothetical protein SEA_RIZWANA_66 [Arthrobacter phage Rizwana]
MGDMADYYSEQEFERGFERRLEQAIDEERADFYGTGVRPRRPATSLTGQQRRQYGVVDAGGVYLPPAKGQIVLGPAKAPSPDPERELQCALELQEQLAARIDYLRDVVRHKPAEPVHSRISISLRYSRKGKLYEYLLVRTPDKRWFSTGVKPGTQEFSNWNAVANWLMSDDIYGFDITPLEKAGDPPF